MVLNNKSEDEKDDGFSLEKPKLIQSSLLFEGSNRVIIEHAQQHYCLRITRNEKLILTKD